jgi:hypothetical protein
VITAGTVMVGTGVVRTPETEVGVIVGDGVYVVVIGVSEVVVTTGSSIAGQSKHVLL